MNDNVSSAIRLRSLVLRLSDTLGDLANDEASIPGNSELRFSLAILDEYVVNQLSFFSTS